MPVPAIGRVPLSGRMLSIGKLLLLAASLSAAPPFIRRLDGSRLPVAQAEAFALKTLAEAHVTGAQIAFVDRGKLVWSAAFGVRRCDPPLPMDLETTTWAASITKSVFATYVMQLVERGELSLDTPIAKLLPRPLPSYQPYRESAVDVINDPRWAKVTARHLLSHSSGLLNFAFLEPDKTLHLHFAPGARFSYSGEGLNLLQFVIEQQKGQPLDQL